MKPAKTVGAQGSKLERHVPHQAHDVIAFSFVIQPSRSADAMADADVGGEPEIFPGTVLVSHRADTSRVPDQVRSRNLHVIKQTP